MGKLPPGPRYPSLIQAVGFWTRPLAWLERQRAQYGNRFTTRFPLSPPFVILSDPDQIKQIYTAPADVLHPGEGARILEPIVGLNSLILLDGDAHMEQRKLLLPAFHGERMARLEGLVREVVEAELETWPTEADFSMQPRMQRLTLEIILRAVFGLAQGPRLDALRERLGLLLRYGDSPMTLLGEPPQWLGRILNRVGPVAGFMTLRDEIDENLFEVIEERRAASQDGDDVLAMLLDARHEDGSPMSPQEIRDELMTLLIAGHETTASTLSWAFDRITRAPEVLARLASEADADNGDEYVEATIRETLRCRPVLPNTAPRLVKQPVEIGGWQYEPGVALVANAYLVHHDPAIYPQPYAFRPERFVGEKPGTYTWIPFGGGRRRCVGASFALLEMKTVIPAVLRRFVVEPSARGTEVARRRNITIRPGEGARVRLGERAPAPAVAA
jgi:cytochrome P450